MSCPDHRRWAARTQVDRDRVTVGLRDVEHRQHRATGQPVLDLVADVRVRLGDLLGGAAEDLDRSLALADLTAQFLPVPEPGHAGSVRALRWLEIWNARICWLEVAPPTGLEPVTLRLTVGRVSPTGLSGGAMTGLPVGIVVWCGSNRREFVDSFMDRPSIVDGQLVQGRVLFDEEAERLGVWYIYRVNATRLAHTDFGPSRNAHFEYIKRNVPGRFAR
jgi:hypothetical protein